LDIDATYARYAKSVAQLLRYNQTESWSQPASISAGIHSLFSTALTQTKPLIPSPRTGRFSDQSPRCPLPLLLGSLLPAVGEGEPKNSLDLLKQVGANALRLLGHASTKQAPLCDLKSDF